MALPLAGVLGYAPLTQSIRVLSSDVPNPFPPELFTVKPANRILGDRAKYIRLTGKRQTSKFAKYGAPSRSRPLADIGDAAVRMLHTHEDISIELVQMQNLMSFESYTQDMGMDWLNFQLGEAGRRQQNTRIIAVASVLRYGKIYIDVDGNLLPSSSGADVTVDFNIPATHQNQINGIINASWALPGTDIPGQIAALQVYSLQETGMELKTALYGKNVRKYLMQNDGILDFLARDDKGRGQLLYDNTIPSGLFGITDWRPIYTSFFEDDSNVLQEIWNDDIIVFLPALDQPDKMNWWAAWEGSYPVPKKFEVLRSGADPFANHVIEYGMFSYALPRLDIPSYTIHYGDTFLAGPRNEKAMFIATVAF